jgi:hypothetical protein
VFTVGTDPIYGPGDIASVNYSAGVSGWQIGGDGDVEFNNILARGIIFGFGNTTDYFGNVLDQSFNLSERGLYFINDDTKLDSGSLVAGDVDTSGFTSKGLLFSYYDESENDYYTIEILYQRNGTFVPSSIMYKGMDNQNPTPTNILEIRGPGSTDPNDLGYGFIKAHRDLIIERDLYANGKIFLDKQTTIDTGTDFPYTVDADDFYIRIEDGGTIGGTITLPTATGSGRVLVIKDTTGTAGSASFTVQRSGSDTIDGATSTSINTNFQTIRLIDAVSGKWELI